MDWKMYALAAAVGFGGAWTAQDWRYGRQIAQIERDQAQAMADAEKRARAQETRWRTTIEGVQIDAREQLAQVADDIAAADAAADGLRRELDRLRRRAASCAAPADRGDTAGSATVLLANLLAEVESRGRELASEADRRRVAGQACEKAYQALR